jgi:hypothetical protein
MSRAMRVRLDDLKPGQLSAKILQDPYAEIYRNGKIVDAENIYAEVEGHIRHHLAAAQSAKRSAVYEVISDSPIILGTLMLDPASIVAMLKTTPVFYEFYRGHGEAMSFARNLVRAKEIDQNFRAQNGYSDARIFHVAGLELQADPEMLNRKIDAEREQLIEQRISSTRSSRAMLRDFFKRQANGIRFGIKLLKRHPKKSAYFFFKALKNSLQNTQRKLQDFPFKQSSGAFLRASAKDIVKLFPSFKKLKDDALSINKSDLKQGRILAVMQCFHVSHFGIIGTYTASTVIEAHQLLDYAIETPLKSSYNKHFREFIEAKLDKAAYQLESAKSRIALKFKLSANKDTVSVDTANDNQKPVTFQETSLKAQSTPAEKPVNIHRLDRENQRILRSRRRDLKSCLFNSAAKAGETYFVYDLGRMTLDAFRNASEASDYTLGSFYFATTVLSIAVTNHICIRRIEIFNRLQSERSKMARKTAQKVSLENNIRIVKESLEKLDEPINTLNNSFRDQNIKDIVNILERLVKIEKRSFDSEIQEKIREFLNALMEHPLVIEQDKDEQNISALISKVHPSYLQKPLIIKKSEPTENLPS